MYFLWYLNIMICWMIIIGSITTVAGGFVIACSLIYIFSVLLGKLCNTLGFRLTRVYHLTVITYWLDRLEKEGTHCFERVNNNHANHHNRE